MIEKPADIKGNSVFILGVNESGEPAFIRTDSNGNILSNESFTTPTATLVTSAATVIDANDDRRAIEIQNLTSEPLKIKLGSGASATVFNYVEPADMDTDNGSSSVFCIKGYKGIVSFYAASTVRCIVTEWE